LPVSRRALLDRIRSIEARKPSRCEGAAATRGPAPRAMLSVKIPSHRKKPHTFLAT
jgi:hypothetical protein